MTLQAATIYHHLLPAGGTHTRRLAHGLLIAIAGSACLALSARIQMPMWPVPMTLQTLAVLAIAMIFGARVGAATVALYLAEGAIGLPVFASGGGITYFAGPTGGFLLSFLPSAALVGWLADRGSTRSVGSALLTTLPGLAVIYLIGAGWLAAWAGIETAIASAVLPFLPGDLIKAMIVALSIPATYRLLSGTR